MDKKTISIVIFVGFLMMGLFTTGIISEENSYDGVESANEEIEPRVKENNHVNNQGIYEEPRISDWKMEIEKILSSNRTRSQKGDDAILLVRRYPPTEKEINLFATYIMSEYESGRLFSHLSNEKYMLENLFVARSIDYHYDDYHGHAIDRFAYQYTRVVLEIYRGSATLDNVVIQGKLERMDSYLIDMKNTYNHQ